MPEPMLSVREYLLTYQGPHSGNHSLKIRTAKRALALAEEKGITPGELLGPVMHRKGKQLPNTRYQVKTYPKSVLDQAFREARG